MKPKIDETRFGSITVAGVKYGHDVIIPLSGKVEKRKKLSKELFGTAHIISQAEAESVYEEERIGSSSGLDNPARQGFLLKPPSFSKARGVRSSCCPPWRPSAAGTRRKMR